MDDESAEVSVDPLPSWTVTHALDIDGWMVHNGKGEWVAMVPKDRGDQIMAVCNAINGLLRQYINEVDDGR